MSFSAVASKTFREGHAAARAPINGAETIPTESVFKLLHLIASGFAKNASDTCHQMACVTHAGETECQLKQLSRQCVKNDANICASQTLTDMVHWVGGVKSLEWSHAGCITSVNEAGVTVRYTFQLTSTLLSGYCGSSRSSVSRL